MASFGGPHSASPQAAPPGWHMSWSDEHSQWYYVNTATGFSQWNYPSGPTDTSQPGATPQPAPQVPDQHQQPQQEHVWPSANAQPDAQGEQSRGLMSMAAGAFLGHEMHENKHNSSNQHNILGSMATMIGSAGVGALGAKLFGGKTKPQAASPPQPAPTPGHPAPWASPPPFQGYPALHSEPPGYPAHSPPPPVHMGQPMPPNGPNHGQYAMAMGGAANFSHNQHQPMTPSVTAGSGGAGAFYGGASGPRLFIHAAYFADKDVTQKVRMLVGPEQKISFENMKDEFGDPWPEAERKALSILYQYGDRPMEVWAGSTETKPVTIEKAALSNERMSFVNKNPGRIVCLIWGEASVLTDIRVEKLEKEGELDCKDLGNGGWWAWEPRTLICYYRGPNGDIEAAHAREGGTLRLPWNPLAKWS